MNFQAPVEFGVSAQAPRFWSFSLKSNGRLQDASRGESLQMACLETSDVCKETDYHKKMHEKNA